ncbi:Exocyst complex component EXO84A [Linum grandiflorum]
MRELSIGDSAELEENLPLKDRLKAFKSSSFDPDAYFTTRCQTMNEKEIRHLCSYLIELKKASAEEMRKSVYANYAAFIRTSREITDLEGQLMSMRNLLSNQGNLVHALAEQERIDSLWVGSDQTLKEDLSQIDKMELSKTEEWLMEFSNTLDVLLAERRMDEVMKALLKGEMLVEDASEEPDLNPKFLMAMQASITEQRMRFADQLSDTISQPSTRRLELRSAVEALKRLGDGPRAHTLLLQYHQKKLQSSIRSIRSSTSSSGGGTGGSYATIISQFVFSTIARAMSDSMSVFGEESAYTSELVSWAVKQTESFALLLKRHVLASSAATGGLRVSADCMQVCLGHCSLLEARGLSLSPVLLRVFRSSVEQAFHANLKKIEHSTAALAVSDDWVLSFSPAGGKAMASPAPLSNSVGSQPKLSSSANKFNSMVQEFLEDIVPLECLQLDGPALEGVQRAFNTYVDLLIHALPGSTETEENLEGSGRVVRPAETEIQQLALLANASLLADELLPRAATKLLSSNHRMDEQSRRGSDKPTHLPEQREWKRKLQRSVDRLRDSFCRLHALELIFTDEGDTNLNAHTYTSMDDHTEEPEWFPSPIFQLVFTKITNLASVATEVLVGRERFATVLLMRLMETIILWLSDDQAFWEEIEQGSKPLGPFALQQLYLDMEFVLIFASQGRYLSRSLHQVIKDIIARAIDAASATGVDPYSVLPEEDWFNEVSQIAIKMLAGKSDFANMDREVSSPTASVSASSVISDAN